MLSTLKPLTRSVNAFSRRMVHSKNYLILGNESQFESIEEAAGGKVLYFTASWCPPCKAIAPIFEKLSTENLGFTFVKIDIDEFGEAAAKYNIRSVPTFVFMNGTKKISQFSGASEADLKKNLQLLETAK